MKNICIICNHMLDSSYIINEKGKQTSDNVPVGNIKKEHNEVLKFFISKYQNRKVRILIYSNSEDDLELEEKLKEKLPKAEIEFYAK